jgi:DNA-binding MarR family transcriptional regulator
MTILGALVKEGPMCPQEISSKLDMAPRTVSFALRRLLKRQLLRKIPNLNDMRRPMYHVDMETAQEVLERAKISPFAWTQKA